MNHRLRVLALAVCATMLAVPRNGSGQVLLYSLFERYTDSLAEVIAAETRAKPGDIEPWVVANALLGVHRALLAYVREQMLETDADAAEIVRRYRRQAKRAFARLEGGLGAV